MSVRGAELVRYLYGAPFAAARQYGHYGHRRVTAVLRNAACRS
ncbi:hypothetical protein [Sphingopyxis alaskensis]|jgi:hypothetical protein|nr:hypothetical protein [Sphingopyxis alaskensis]